MSDGTAALMFGKIFRWFASDPTEQHKEWARELWPAINDYDFSAYQMHCDEELRTLGLARKRIDECGDHGGEVWFYGPEGDDER